jgi:hypothetical protein
MNRRGILRAHLGLFAVVSLVLFATTDDRFPGSTADGRQMIWTAVAIAETGEIGQARGRDLTVPRPDGDSVSRFGLGMSFAQVPAALGAPIVEARLGPATSQPLFLIAPFLFVLAAAAFAGLTVRELGGSHSAERTAILFATLAGPLGTYAALDASESLQAAALMIALWASVVAARSSGRAATRASLLAGAACGIALLTKSALLVVAPLTLLPLLAGHDRSRQVTTGDDGLRRVTTGNDRWVRTLVALAVFAVFGAVWIDLEVTRFGAPLMGYAGESFSHSPIDGLWRLLVGVNKGLLWYFPALVAVLVGLAHNFGDWRSARGLTFLAACGCLIAMLLTAAGWWAWHGDDGWGPRLIVAAVPLLAVCAALAVDTWPATTRTTLIAISVLMNLHPLFQHPTPVFHFRLSASWPAADASFAAQLPRFARREAAGKTYVVPESVLASIPEASPFVVLPWFFVATHFGDSSVRAEALRHPPWIAARPDIVPSEPFVTAISSTPVRWPHWGRSFGAGNIGADTGAYDAGLTDQVLRAQSLRSLVRAERLARKLLELAPGGYADALFLETLRLSNRRPEAVQYLSNLSRDRRQHPAINVVLALFERDSRNDQTAKAFLNSVVESFRDSPVERALSQPLAQWPPDFASMTRDDRLQVDIR